MFKQNISFEVWGGEKGGKYRLRDTNKVAIENTPEETCQRVSKALADIEATDEQKEIWFKKFNSIMGTRFAGGGRIMANAGGFQYKKETSPINCTVMRQIPDSMNGILQVAKEAAITLKAGCGVGYDFSTIRPKGADVFGAGAETSGIISFMKIFDAVCSTVMSGGARRGAQMGCLDIQSPEVEEFITAKRTDGVLRYFNCSVLVNSEFMNAVETDGQWDLWFWEKLRNKKENIKEKDIKIIAKDDIPYNHSNFNYFSFDKDHNEVLYKNCNPNDIFIKKIYRTVKAKYLFDVIMKSTYEFAEPGFIIIDRMNFENNLYFCETLRATNPCLSGDTRLATQYGLVQLEELYKKQSAIKATVDNRGLSKNKDLGTSIRDAVPVFMTDPNAKIFKITTKHGYTLKATEWHELYTQRGKLKLQDIKVGDTLYIQSGRGQFGSQGSYELGLVLGMMTGDGWFCKNKKKENEKAFLGFWGKDRILSNKYLEIIQQMISKVPQFNNKKYTLSIDNIETRDHDRIGSDLLARYLQQFNFTSETKLVVPEIVWRGTEECVKGYLKSLYQADGHVDSHDKRSGMSIRLNSIHKEFLQQIQLLLSNFGIMSGIHLRKKECERMLSDGKGGSKLYKCKNNYELIINGCSLHIFMKEIGFLLDYKNDEYKKFIINYEPIKEVDKYETEIVDIEFDSYGPVYDTTQPDGNCIVSNGFHSGNCGEQPLAGLSSCLLGSMILPPYVKNPFSKEAQLDFDQLYEDVLIASRALDNVVEINNLPLPEMQEQILLKRRHGLGITGLGSVFNMLGLKYGSAESVEIAEKISLILAKASLIANIELAKEKGPAPIFSDKKSRELVLASKYLSRLIDTCENKKQIINDIIEYGLRYSHATSIAPTGTMSLTWGNNCSNGVEPVFANSYLRNIRVPGKKTKTQEEVYDYAFFLWKEKYKDKKLPDNWTTTENLSVSDHIKIQAVMQKWCDSSISKTINIPTDYSFDDFKKVYMDGWKMGLKGITTFRFNPKAFSGVLVQKTDLEDTIYVFRTEDGKEHKLKGSEQVEYDGEIHNVANLFDALKEGMYGDM